VLSELLSAGRDDWTETTIGSIAEVVGGGTPSTKVTEYWGGEIVWLTPTEVVPRDGQEIFDSERHITTAGLRNSGAQLLPQGSVILTSRASVGFVALAGIELCTNQGFQSLIPNDYTLAKFLMFWVQANRHRFESRAAGSTFKEISRSNVKSMKLALPSLAEQRRIVEIVSSMDELIQSADKAVADAKNLRSGLLSDLLSGDHEIPESFDRFLGAA
jgi:type I restriction enzyme S subunit